MANKFKVGDRVVATVDSGCGAYYKGAVGTVLEISTAPYVDWDDLERVQGVRGSRWGTNVWACAQQKLELYEPELIGVVTWVRPKCTNNIVNEAVRYAVLAITKIYNFLRGKNK